MRVRFGKAEFDYPSPEMGELTDSSGLLGRTDRLRERLAEDGYLLLRGMIDRQKVLDARAFILEYMEGKEALAPGTAVLEGVMPKGARWVNLMNREVSHAEPVLEVLESTRLFEFFRDLFGEEARTYEYKWMRAVGNEGFTGCHYDVVYMGRGSERVHTVWIPIADIPVHQGTLAICEGSHRMPEFERLRQTYGKLDVDRDRAEGWFSEDPREILDKFGGHWITSDFQAGDVLTFGLYTLHASTTNTTDRYRLSCDVRYQPASDPVDERWVGKMPGHAEGKPTKRMSELRAAWRI